MKNKKSKNEALNEGEITNLAKDLAFGHGGLVPFDLLNRLGGAWRGMRRGYAGSDQITNIDEAKNVLMDDLMNAFMTYSKSLRRMGYNATQIHTYRELYEENMKTLIDTVMDEAVRQAGSSTP